MAAMVDKLNITASYLSRDTSSARIAHHLRARPLVISAAIIKIARKSLKLTILIGSEEAIWIP